LPDASIRYVALKGSGPGGQAINKTNSAIQMTHVPTGIVVKSQATRSKSQNYKIARRILAEKVEERKRAKKKSAEKKKRRKYRRLAEEKGKNGEYDDEYEDDTVGPKNSPTDGS
ncbi:hypothetical protein DV735_g3664, partial [Chaetothyriales sp. CBS 134920]